MSSVDISQHEPARLATREDRAAAGRPPLVVECVGLPGAGKSSVVARALAKLERRGYRCADRPRVARPTDPRAAHLARLARFYAGHLSLLAAAGRVAMTSRARPWIALQSGLRLHAWSYRLHRAGVMDVDLVILDQGPVQQAWSMMLHHGFVDDAALVAAVAGVIASASSHANADAQADARARLRYASVWFEVAPRVAAERIYHRETMESTFDRLDPNASLALLEQRGAWLRRLFDGVAKATGAPTHTIDTTQTLEAEAGSLVDFVERVAGSWRRP